MADQLHTAAEAAAILKVRESWLKTKASARLIPCTFIGKHLRFSDADIEEIMRAGARQTIAAQPGRPARRPA
jgi:Helix-turn-helix domain